DQINFQYSLDATSLTTGNWTNLDALNFSSPVSNGITGALDGNAAANSKFITAAIRNISLPAGATFWIRWTDVDATSSDDGLAIDNLSIKVTANFPCDVPAAAATNLTFSSITDASITGGFTPANPAADEYLVVMTSNANLSADPVDGQHYAPGDNVGGGTVLSMSTATSFVANNLAGGTTYNFFVYAVNTICTDGPKYLTADGFVLTGDATTLVPLPACVAPADQPANLQFGSITTNSIQGSFTGNGANEYLVIASTSETLGAVPVDGQVYNAGSTIGNGMVIQKSGNTVFIASALQPNTAYYFFVFSANSTACKNGPAYNTVSPLSASASTMPLPVCAAPVNAPSSLQLNASYSGITGSFTASASADDYLIVKSTSGTLNGAPVDGTNYSVGSSIGGGIVIANSSSTSFIANGLQSSTHYYFFVFAANANCTGGTKYLSTPLMADASTTEVPPYNVYFGNLHSHSDYSDGNKDHPGYTPADDYNYAKDAECMDFLGISEHNHFSSPDNPGNLITTYHQGHVQADAFNATNPGFLALYGMEWGVISGGGHVVVYGDNMNELFGWESNVGGLTGPNYDQYVPKSTYTGSTGLFKAINDRKDKNTFAMLAHPNNSDFNNLSNIAYDSDADSAIVASAVESGPAFSTDTTYTNPSSMSYLWYYQKLLSKGYRVGPSIDHDNHNTTFGKTTRGRLAVIAPALNRTELFKAIREMHFYATEDCDTKVDFTINNRIMGSEFEDRNAPAIAVNISDYSHDFSTAKIRVMSGIPGSGVYPLAIDSAYGTSLSFIDNSLPINATGYYYIEIYNGNSKIVTSPIWYKRLCTNESIVTISRCGSYEWHGTTYTESGNYTYSSVDETGCTNTEHLALTIYPNPSATITAGGPTTFCPSGSVNLQANAATSYVWSEGSTTQFIQVSQGGSYSVTITDENGCTATSQPLTITVQDVTAPVVHTKNITVSLDASGSAVVTAADVNDGSTDDCFIEATGYNLSKSTFNCSNIGANTVTLTITDASGNVASATAIVTVEDHIKPVVVTKNVSVYLDANGSASIGASDIDNGSNDNCSIASMSLNKTQFSCADLGANTVTLTITDANGNVNSGSAVVTVVDNSTPVITYCPTLPVQCYNPSGTYSIPVLTATDNCSISVSYQVSGATTRSGNGTDASGGYNVGTSTITWTVKDGANNTVTCNTRVVINSPVTSMVPDVYAVNPGGSPNTIYVGYGPSSLTLNSVVSGGTQPYSYKWTENSSAGPGLNSGASYTVSPAQATSYYFNVKDVYGCSAALVIKTIDVVDVRCGAKGDRVSVCQVVKGKSTTSCVLPKDVASLLAGGATLGTCPPSLLPALSSVRSAGAELSVNVLPNPTASEFRMLVQSGSNEPFSVTVTDVLGRVVEKRHVVGVNQFALGSTYRPGIYFAEVQQGSSRHTLKLVKQAN
ncbi:MAG: T9SS type A sorting domain-containing protein, partial [Candidatus Dadabacteria bacterium]